MKRSLEIITVILVLFIVAGALIFASKNGSLKGDDNMFNIFKISNDVSKDIYKEIKVNFESVKFDMDIPNTSLEILKSEGSKIEIECKSYGNSKYYIEQKGSNINIHESRDRMFSLFNWNSGGRVKILIPEGLLSSYFVDMSNNNVIISDIEAEQIEIDSSNGDINMYNVNVKNDIDVEGSNGKIDVENLSANNIEFDSSNGNAVIKGLRANEIIINTSNGSISAYECYSKNMELDTSNGSITLENLADKNYVIDVLEVDTSNGNENINANYKVKR